MNTLEEPFKEFKLIEEPIAESYTFRGNTFVHWFNITFVSGRIIITGDCGDNVFVVGGTNEELKAWCYDVDKDYALGKSRQIKEYYDAEYAEKRVREHLKQMELDYLRNGVDNEESVIGQLDFSDWYRLMLSIENFENREKTFPNYWEMGSIFKIWSPYQEMQYKQLRFAGEWLAKNEGI